MKQKKQPKKTSDILRAAKRLIDTPDKWCQGTIAKGKSGRPVLRDGGYATSYCMVGAVGKAARAAKFDRPILPDVFTGLGEYHPGIWNDRGGRTHAEVMQAFDRAIALAESLGD